MGLLKCFISPLFQPVFSRKLHIIIDLKNNVVIVDSLDILSDDVTKIRLRIGREGDCR